MKTRLHKFIFTIISIMLMGCPLILKAAQVPNQSLASALPAKMGARIVTADWLLNLSINNFDHALIRWLDNTHLIFSLPPLVSGDKWQIEMLDVQTHERKLLGEGYASNPSPDGQWIAFIRNDGESNQLWIMRSNGTDAKQFSHVQGGLAHYQYDYDFTWSPDSKQIALEHQLYIPMWEKGERSRSIIDVINIMTGQSRQVTSFDASIRSLTWLPNGEKLLFMKERAGDFYHEEGNHAWVQTVNVSDGRVQTIAQFDGLQQALNPVASPDGRTLAMMYDADNPKLGAMPSIGLVSLDSIIDESLPAITRLTHEIKLSSPKWSNDSQHIYAFRSYGAYGQIYSIDKLTGNPTQISNLPEAIESYILSPDGLHLAWIGQDAHAKRVIHVADNDGHNRHDILTMSDTPEDMALSEVREISWTTIDYPAKMRGLLVLPLNYQEGNRYPLIVDIHGGGIGYQIYMKGGLLLQSPLEWQMWAAKGYAVFVPEFRSSASFGSQAITDMIQSKDEMSGDIKDIESGVDELISQGIVDSERLAIIGHSAGGHRANRFTVSTHRYRAIVSKEGWVDESDQALAAGASTPTLFVMGNLTLGGVDPNDTVKLLYDAIKAQGVDTQYVQYLDEGHVFQQPANRRDVIERAVKWIDEKTKNKQTNYEENYVQSNLFDKKN